MAKQEAPIMGDLGVETEQAHTNDSIRDVFFSTKSGFSKELLHN